jgi:putative oxidoreductase
MKNIDSIRSTWTPRMLSVLRAVTAFLFMAHGAQKLFGFLAPAGTPGPAMFSQL